MQRIKRAGIAGIAGIIGIAGILGRMNSAAIQTKPACAGLIYGFVVGL